MPRLGYLAFYLLSGLVASLAQIAAMPGPPFPIWAPVARLRA